MVFFALCGPTASGSLPRQIFLPTTGFPMTKKKSSSSKPKTKSKSRAKPRAAEARQSVDVGVRQLVNKSVVISLASDQKRCLSRAGEASQEFSSAMRSAQEKGLNPKAFRAATRKTRTAARDPATALVDWEDEQYYLECLGFNDMITKSMFPASEMRSSKRPSRSKKNGAAEPVQTDIEEQPLAKAMGDAIAADQESEAAASEAVH